MSLNLKEKERLNIWMIIVIFEDNFYKAEDSETESENELEKNADINLRNS